MDLNEIAIYIQVVQLGSFSKAAKKLGMPNSTVSTKISSLEKRLATTLIQRTTRQLKVTEAGLRFFEKCQKGFIDLQNAEREILSHKLGPQGILRISAPVELGSIVLPPLIHHYQNKFPQVQVRLKLTDKFTDLVGEDVDMALRVGKLNDSSLISRQIGTVQYGLFASPHYLKKNSTLKKPQDLSHHQCLIFDSSGDALSTSEWRLENKTAKIKVNIQKHIVSDNLSALKNLLLLGSGVAYFPAFLLKDELQAKKVVRLLPEWGSPHRPVHLIYPFQKFPSPKLTEFLKLLGQDMIK